MTVHQVLACACWLFVFAGFVVYQTIVQRGYVGPVLGGFFTFSISVSLLALLPGWLRLSLSEWKNRWRRGVPVGASVPILFWAFMAIFGASLALGLYRGVNSEITFPLLAYFIKFLGLYVLATSVPLVHQQFAMWNRIVFIALAILILRNSSDGSYLVHLVGGVDHAQQLDYHGLALAFSLISLFAVVGIRALPVRWCLWAVALVGLFFIGARSEFAGFLIAVSVIELLKANSGVKIVTLGCAVLVSVFAVSALLERILLIDSRVLGLIDLQQDQSATERQGMSRSAWSVIQDNPIFGSFAHYQPGEYAHNILSTWVDLGLAGFAVLLLLLTSTFAMLLSCRRKGNGSAVEAAIGLSVMCFVLVLYAKTYFYQLIPLATGVSVACMLRSTTRTERWYEWRPRAIYRRAVI